MTRPSVQPGQTSSPSVVPPSHRDCGHVFRLDELLLGERHASGLGGVRVVHRLHAPPQAKSGKGALNASAEGDAGASEGEAEVCAWLFGGDR